MPEIFRGPLNLDISLGYFFKQMHHWPIPKRI
jgi:hypothetical protein